MTRKDYRRIAEALKASKPSASGYAVSDIARFKQWEKDVLALADTLAADNSRFVRTIFLLSSGLTENSEISEIGKIK